MIRNVFLTYDLEFIAANRAVKMVFLTQAVLLKNLSYFFPLLHTIFWLLFGQNNNKLNYRTIYNSFCEKLMNIYIAKKNLWDNINLKVPEFILCVY